MKKLLFFSLLTLSFFSVSAQFLGAHRVGAEELGPKGNWLIYGSLDYSSTSGPGVHTNSFGTSDNASAPIGVGYFINNNDLIGINYAYANRRENGKNVFNQNEIGFWYSPSVSFGKYFTLIAQVDLHYVWGRQIIPGMIATSGAHEGFDGFRLRAYPMIGINVGGGWALKFKFAELSALYTKGDQSGWLKSHVAGVSGSTFGVGISKAFDFRKKH